MCDTCIETLPAAEGGLMLPAQPARWRARPVPAAYPLCLPVCVYPPHVTPIVSRPLVRGARAKASCTCSRIRRGGGAQGGGAHGGGAQGGEAGLWGDAASGRGAATGTFLAQREDDVLALRDEDD